MQCQYPQLINWRDFQTGYENDLFPVPFHGKEKFQKLLYPEDKTASCKDEEALACETNSEWNQTVKFILSLLLNLSQFAVV